MLGGNSYMVPTWLPHHSATPAQNNNSSQEGQEIWGRADVTRCGRSWKWSYRGRSMLGFKPKCRAAVAFLPCGLWGRRLSWLHGLKGCRRTPTGPPWGAAIQFWIKSRCLAEHGGLEEARIQMGICPAKLQTSSSFPENRYPWLAWFGKGRQNCVFMAVFCLFVCF